MLLILFSCAPSQPASRDWSTIREGTYTVGSLASPTHSPRSVTVGGFAIQRTEVTVGEFVRFLNRRQPDSPYTSPQILFHRDRYQAQVDTQLPVAYVSYADAVAYANWLSNREQARYRLPTATEWEIAASAGRAGRPFPWGWASPHERAQFDANGPERVAQFAPNPFGLYDMAGNVAEWCLVENENDETAPVMGGSWAERDTDLLRVFHRLQFPLTYRDADVGFRLVRITNPNP